MSLKNRKITNYSKNIKALPDRVVGQASYMKAMFDGRTDEEVKNSINGIADDLAATTGAAEIGAAAPADGAATTVQAVMDGLSGELGTVDGATIVGAKVPSGVTASPPVHGGVASVQSVISGLQIFAMDEVRTKSAAYAGEVISEGVEAISDMLENGQRLRNPLTGEMENLSSVIGVLYNALRTEALTADEYDELGLLCDEYDAQGLAAEVFDMRGRMVLED